MKPTKALFSFGGLMDITDCGGCSHYSLAFGCLFDLAPYGKEYRRHITGRHPACPDATKPMIDPFPEVTLRIFRQERRTSDTGVSSYHTTWVDKPKTIQRRVRGVGFSGKYRGVLKEAPDGSWRDICYQA